MSACAAVQRRVGVPALERALDLAQRHRRIFAKQLDDVLEQRPVAAGVEQRRPLVEDRRTHRDHGLGFFGRGLAAAEVLDRRDQASTSIGLDR